MLKFRLKLGQGIFIQCMYQFFAIIKFLDAIIGIFVGVAYNRICIKTVAGFQW